ncbi:hypothetical protein Esti_002208 [Eimeria stiedai]
MPLFGELLDPSLSRILQRHLNAAAAAQATPQQQQTRGCSSSSSGSSSCCCSPLPADCCSCSSACFSVDPATSTFSSSSSSSSNCSSSSTNCSSSSSNRCSSSSSAAGVQPATGSSSKRSTTTRTSSSSRLRFKVWFDPSCYLSESLALFFFHQLQTALQQQQQQRQEEDGQRQRQLSASLILEGFFSECRRRARVSCVKAEAHEPNAEAAAQAAATRVQLKGLNPCNYENIFDPTSSSSSSSCSSRQYETVVFVFLAARDGSFLSSSSAFAAAAAREAADRLVDRHLLKRYCFFLICCDVAAAAAGRAQQQQQQQQAGSAAEKGSCSSATNKNNRSRKCGRSVKSLMGRLIALGANSLKAQQQQQQRQWQHTLVMCGDVTPPTSARKYAQWEAQALRFAVMQQQLQQEAAEAAAACSSSSSSRSSSRSSSKASADEVSMWDSSSSGDDEQQQQQQQQQQNGFACGESPSDLEDLSASAAAGPSAAATAAGTAAAAAAGGALPEQLTKRLRANLEKEGYRLVGSHSAVKMCRWTRASLRGRGGCYKHTFYGIKSFGCMEFTSSVACANRCLFCWRHHTNLAAGEWRWASDEPKDILEEALKQHLRLIKQLKGLPGLRKDFYGEVESRVLHCALSLVGEPIMYPSVNELLQLMHQRHISTFLVTNAQHPEALRALGPVTQLYLSVDAATESDLKALDRPVHRDYWTRFLRCIDILKTKKQRTVFRLTLVHGHNCVLGTRDNADAATPPAAGEQACAAGDAAAAAAGTDAGGNQLSSSNGRKKKQRAVTSTVEGYASLVLRGEPDLVEIKGMTFCGGLDKASLSMENVPRHQQVLAFAQALCKALPSGLYAVACEHEHSCCVLLASTKYLRDGQWYTWIDYPKFFQLVRSFIRFRKRRYKLSTDLTTARPRLLGLFGALSNGGSILSRRVPGDGSSSKAILII